jgi:hypothetical protein
MLGYHVLRGEVSIARGGRLVLGCALLFSSAALARTLISLGADSGGVSALAGAPPVPLPPVQAQSRSGAFDPYAGASVPQ